jgi:hypothetical protein
MEALLVDEAGRAWRNRRIGGGPALAMRLRDRCGLFRRY